MEHPIGPFSIPDIRPFIPEAAKPWILILFVLVIQFSGGVYLSAAAEMTGDTALMHEDILMAGYAALAGMSLTFVIMFRLKFAFQLKTGFLICGTAIIIANLICMHTRNVPLLVGTCFIAGFFRMWGTFLCNTTIQLWLTPKRDLSVFFCYVYLVVNGAIQLSGILTVHATEYGGWEYMQWTMIGLLLLLMFTVMLIFRTQPGAPRLPLYGIDWLGMLMWGLTLLCILFVCIYGEHYDWFASPYIRMAGVSAVALIVLNRLRASFIRHPFIFNNTFTFPIIGISLTVYVVADILLAPSHVFEHALMEGILGYDSLHSISLNYVGFAGTVIGAIFSWLTFARRKWTYQSMLGIAFGCYTIYLAWFYFFLDYNLPKEALIFPIFVRSFGYVVMAICLLTALCQLPFPFHFFQGVAIQGFMSAVCGSVIGTAIVGHWLNLTMKKNYMLLGMTADRVNPEAAHLPLPQLYGAVQAQSLMVSMKEICGILLIFSITCVLIFLLHKSSIRPLKVIHPRFKTIRRAIYHDLKVRIWFRVMKQQA